MSDRRLTDEQFRALMDLFMCSDPYPDTEANHEIVENLLDAESNALGYSDWIVAFHEFDRKSPMWLDREVE